MTPIMRAKSAGSYVSQNVFDGKRPLTEEHAARLREIAEQEKRRPSGKMARVVRSRHARAP